MFQLFLQFCREEWHHGILFGISGLVIKEEASLNGLCDRVGWSEELPFHDLTDLQFFDRAMGCLHWIGRRTSFLLQGCCRKLFWELGAASVRSGCVTGMAARRR